VALKVFVDFDGTITQQDIGNAFFRKFVGEEYDGFLREYKEERISARECFWRGVKAIGELKREDAAAFVKSYPIDETFRKFVAYCRSQRIEFHILSDGLDFYIKEILAQNGLEGISVFANALEFVPSARKHSDSLTVTFPYTDAECERCACCKRNIMLTRSGEEDIIVYIGEGYSDRCPVQYADIVFARDALQTYCQEQNISYFLYSTFDDVIARLASLVSKKKLRKRLAAETKRKELFIAEP
jgi:2-hydroxy-3-keto-5-methylthiopentenyl-1-phosphate phosphatase